MFTAKNTARVLLPLALTFGGVGAAHAVDQLDLTPLATFADTDGDGDRLTDVFVQLGYFLFNDTITTSGLGAAFATPGAGIDGTSLFVGDTFAFTDVFEGSVTALLPPPLPDDEGLNSGYELIFEGHGHGTAEFLGKDFGGNYIFSIAFAASALDIFYDENVNAVNSPGSTKVFSGSVGGGSGLVGVNPFVAGADAGSFDLFIKGNALVDDFFRRGTTQVKAGDELLVKVDGNIDDFTSSIGPGGELVTAGNTDGSVSVPEPGPLALLGFGFGLAGLFGRRARKAA